MKINKLITRLVLGVLGAKVQKREWGYSHDTWLLPRLKVSIKSEGELSESEQWLLSAEIIKALCEIDKGAILKYDSSESRLYIRFNEYWYTFDGEMPECYIKAGLDLLLPPSKEERKEMSGHDAMILAVIHRSRDRKPKLLEDILELASPEAQEIGRLFINPNALATASQRKEAEDMLAWLDSTLDPPCPHPAYNNYGGKDLLCTKCGEQK